MNKTEIKLKAAAEDIKDVLRKYDIAGAVALHAPGHSEFVIHMLTSYSCAYQYEDESVRFYAKAKDFKTKEEHLAKIKDTANMLTLLAETTGRMFMMLEPLSDKFDKISGAVHSKTRKTS